MAMQEVLERNLAKSSLLSLSQMPSIIPLIEVIRVLNDAKISFVLVGAHGLATWRGKPRATEDVDVVVAAKQLKKAVAALTASFENLESVDLAVVVRLRDRETHDVLIDVMKPFQQPYREALKHTRTVTIDGESVRIPSLEMALVMKFSAMISINRADEDKHLDAHDFIRMVKNNPKIDKRELARFATLVYPEADKEILDMVRRVEAGEQLIL